MKRRTLIGSRPGLLAVVALLFLGLWGSASPASKIELLRDDASGRLQVLIDGREAFVYQYAESIDLPHYWPMNSPRGKNMLVRQTEPYPHHRSFWFADTVRLNGGRPVSVYYALSTGRDLGTDPKTYTPPFNDHIRHMNFKKLEAGGNRAVIETELRWEMDGRTPVLDERRTVVVHALGEGEYLLDLTFTLTASFGEVAFVSDDVHYAWPFLRLDKIWSGENGGKIITDTGGAGMPATNLKPARWLDYSNRVDSESAGVAIFQYPDGQEHRWLTREYGCVGPRRPDDRSGKPFALARDETITQRVGVLVHAGDVLGGRVAERYKKYIEGNWK